MKKPSFVAIVVLAAFVLVISLPAISLAHKPASPGLQSEVKHAVSGTIGTAGVELLAEEMELAENGYQQPHLYPAPQMFPGEERFIRNIRQITFGGENAEAYWSPDGKKLSFQSKREGDYADRIYIMDVMTGGVRKIDTGTGVCTCSFFLSDNRRIVFASTHADMHQAPPPPDYSQGYVWPIHPEYELYIADSETGEILERLTDSPGYDAEIEGVDWAHGDRLVFTSMRDGDLDLYAMDIVTKKVTRLTQELGYDGGSFPGYDGTKIVWRRQPVKSEEEKADYLKLLSIGLVRPGNLDLWIMNRDGSGKQQLTFDGGASFGPNLYPDNSYLIYSSNRHNPRGRNFDLFVVPSEGGAPEQVTFFDDFDGFPMFSPDGKHLVFASNRNSLIVGETNLFVAEWVYGQ